MLIASFSVSASCSFSSPSSCFPLPLLLLLLLLLSLASSALREELSPFCCCSCTGSSSDATASITICTLGVVAKGDDGEGGVVGTRSAIGVTGADLDLCARGESAAIAAAAGKLLVVKEDGGLMADVRLLDGEEVFSLVEVMSPFPPFSWVRIEVLSNFVPLAGGDEGGDEPLLLL